MLPSPKDKGIDTGDITRYEAWLYDVTVGGDALGAAGVVDKDDDGYDDTTCSGKCGSCFNDCGMKVMTKGKGCRDPRFVRKLMSPLIIFLPLYVLICY